MAPVRNPHIEACLQAKRVAKAAVEPRGPACSPEELEAAAGASVDLDSFMRSFHETPYAQQAALWEQKRAVMLQYALASACKLLQRPLDLQQVRFCPELLFMNHSFDQRSGLYLLAWLAPASAEKR